MFRTVSILMLLFCGASICLGGFLASDWPYAPFAGQDGSTAIHMKSDAIQFWADAYQDLVYGDNVAEKWKTPGKALGPAVGDSYDIVSLGQGGQITLSFSRSIVDGEGFDFAVFENAFDDYFLELAWVEVSSDGIHFVRFPDVSYTALGMQRVQARDIHGLAGKYRQGYGTPFDLSELDDVATYISTNGAALSAAYINAFTSNYAYLDTDKVNYVRLVDVVGDGNSMSSAGAAIIDPYPTVGSVGFDLDAIGVMNGKALDGESQRIFFDVIPNQKMAYGSTPLNAYANSNLPVQYEIRSGPARVDAGRLYFTGTGTVEVVASQSGNDVFAAAAPVVHSFVVAEDIQHIFVEQLPNQLKGADAVLVRAYSSSGLPVSLQVSQGPDDVMVGESSHILNTANEIGAVTLRAFQQGNAAIAPAEDVFMRFNIVESSATNAPIQLSDWVLNHELPVLSVEAVEDAYDQPALNLHFALDLQMDATASVVRSTDLVSWTNTVPVLTGQTYSNGLVVLHMQLSADSTNGFYRLEFDASK